MGILDLLKRNPAVEADNDDEPTEDQEYDERDFEATQEYIGEGLRSEEDADDSEAEVAE